MAKIPLESDYIYEHKRISKLANEICPGQAIIPNHSGLCPKINFILRDDPELIKDMLNYGFINLIYVNEDCRELKLLPRKIQEAVVDLKRIFKADKLFQVPYCLC